MSEHKYDVGDEVRHPEYGAGTVTKAPPDITEETMVRFEDLGMDGRRAHSGKWVMTFQLELIAG